DNFLPALPEEWSDASVDSENVSGSAEGGISRSSSKSSVFTQSDTTSHSIEEFTSIPSLFQNVLVKLFEYFERLLRPVPSSIASVSSTGPIIKSALSSTASPNSPARLSWLSRTFSTSPG